MLLGREQERQEIERAFAGARAGLSTAVGVIGEPGIGKSALLDWAAAAAAGMHVLRARGIESEAQIPFGSLLELLRPALIMLDRIPGPQALALESALAIRPAAAQDRFAVGAATLSLLAAYAEDDPVAVLVDDAQWLDEPSAQALLFAVRRLVADPITVVIAVREGEPSLLDGADLPALSLGGLSGAQARQLLGGVTDEAASRLHRATAGNPLALLELAAAGPPDLALAPEGAPLLVSARIVDAFLRRFGTLEEPSRRPLVLAATSDTGELTVLARAAARMGVELSGLTAAEAAGLIWLRGGSVEFRHPLARSAIYAEATPELRREAHRALAAALPDRDVDRRAWHLAAAALGPDDQASAALEQAGLRARARSAYAAGASAFERAARLSSEEERRGRLLFQSAEAAWLGGGAERALDLLARAREASSLPATRLDIDELEGHIVTRRGPVVRGSELLLAAAERAEPERAAEILAEVAVTCFYSARPRAMLEAAERARALLPSDAAVRSRFMAAAALGMAHVIGGDAPAGAEALREALGLGAGHSELGEDARLVPWMALVPIFLRDADSGRFLLDQALETARRRTAIGVLPFVLCLLARDQATTERWAEAEATYREAIGLARESGQRTDLGFSLAGLAWLLARRGREAECRTAAGEALALSTQLTTTLHEIWGLAALGELELGLGDATRAAGRFQDQHRVLAQVGITDVDLSPAPELVEVYLRLGRREDAAAMADEFDRAATAKGRPWPRARALRCRALLASDGEMEELFEAALRVHDETLDVFETARTRLAFGARLRRARSRVLARDQLRLALGTFERLDARPWAERARAELAATGETLRSRDASAADELTPQELQISLLLAGGRTTREAAAALFLSPKTIEYHLRHVYLKLDIHSREELADKLAGEPAPASMAGGPPRHG